MEHTQVTTLNVGARQSCAFTMDDAFSGVGTIAQQPHFAAVTRRDLMAAVNTASRELGLRAASVVVLDALLSCLPCHDAKTGKDGPITPLTLLTVFACNDTLCFRAKGITDRQLRRHLARLEAVDLIQRRDSANGKRFPILRKGRVIGAFGIDLSPLLARSGQILALAQQHRDEASELRGLKSFVQKLRIECLAQDLADDARGFVEATRNMLRRTGTTRLQALAIIDRLKAILNGTIRLEDTRQHAGLTLENPADTATIDNSHTALIREEKTGTDGQNVRHKETDKPYTKKTMPLCITELWARLTTIPAFYPEVPCSEHGLLQLVFGFGKMLRIQQGVLARAISTLGLWETVMAADQMADKADEVICPDSYLSRIIALGAGSQVGHGQLAFAR
ncbi:MAG: helix-turn-helix domain-containing protein [Pseudomonadota bacterium]